MSATLYVAIFVSMRMEWFLFHGIPIHVIMLFLLDKKHIPNIIVCNYSSYNTSLVSAN